MSRFVALVAPLMAVVGLATCARAGEMLNVGDAFPSFTLSAHDGVMVKSDDLAGSPYLLYFYPKADTPGCTKEACAFRDSWAEAQMLGLKVFGVSYDSPADNKAFADKFGLQFPLLSDTERKLAQAVGAAGSMGFPSRISYLVGGDGKVLKAYPKVTPAEHAAEVIADLKALTRAATSAN